MARNYAINDDIKDTIPLWKVVGGNVRERYRTGVQRKYNTPIALWEKFEEYCEYVDDNPILGEEVKTQGKSLVRVKVKYRRAYTLEEFCLFAGVGNAYLRQFVENHKDLADDRSNEMYAQVIAEMKEVVKKQQFDGATAGLFKENIIARYLGLAERTINENLNSVPLSRDEILKISRELENDF